MYNTISESIEFTSIEEFEQTCKSRVLERTAITPISVVTDSYEDESYYWCRILLVNSTSVVDKYVHVWDKSFHDWQYAYDAFCLTMRDRD